MFAAEATMRVKSEPTTLAYQGGSFEVESVTDFAWNGWKLRLKSVVSLDWNMRITPARVSSQIGSEQ